MAKVKTSHQLRTATHPQTWITAQRILCRQRLLKAYTGQTTRRRRRRKWRLKWDQKRTKLNVSGTESTSIFVLRHNLCFLFFSCKTPSQPLITHCIQCWDSRKQWIPERPRRTWTSGKKQQALTSPVTVPKGMDNNNENSAIEGETIQRRSDTISSQKSGIEMLELSEVLSEGKPRGLDLTKLTESISHNHYKSSRSNSSSASSSTMLSELGLITNLNQMAKMQEICMFCEIRPRNAIFIHGKLGHQVCP